MRFTLRYCLALVPRPILLLSLYVLEFSAVITAMAVYKKGERLLPAFLATPAGFVLIAAVALLVISISVILLQLRSIPYTWTKWVTAHLVLNLCSVVFVFIIAEVVIRVFAVDSIEAPIFANTVLRPRSWESVVAQ